MAAGDLNFEDLRSNIDFTIANLKRLQEIKALSLEQIQTLSPEQIQTLTPDQGQNLGLQLLVEQQAQAIQISQYDIEKKIQCMERLIELETHQADITDLATTLGQALQATTLGQVLQANLQVITGLITSARANPTGLTPEGLLAELLGIQQKQQKLEQQLTEQYLKTILRENYSILFSEYTSCATHRRVASYGGFFAGKMMDYFFKQYMQLPSFFKYFESYLKICIQYTTTALIYDAHVPPYNLIVVDPTHSFSVPFFQYFQKMKISFSAESAVTPEHPANHTYILTTLQEKTREIKAISHFLTKDFMIDPDVADNETHFTDGSTLSTASESTHSSSASQSFCAFDQTSIYSSNALKIFLLVAPLEGSVIGDADFEQNLGDGNGVTGEAPGFVAVATPEEGGNKPRLTTVATTKRNRKYKSRSSPKRKSKSNNKSKSRHKRNSKVTNKTFCRKRKSYLSRKPHKKQTLKKCVKR